MLLLQLATSSIRFGEIKKILELPELKDQHLIIAGDWFGKKALCLGLFF
jgi:hypothetical protein